MKVYRYKTAKKVRVVIAKDKAEAIKKAGGR